MKTVNKNGQIYELLCNCNSKFKLPRPKNIVYPDAGIVCYKCQLLKWLDLSKPLDSKTRKWLKSLTRQQKIMLAINLENFQDMIHRKHPRSKCVISHSRGWVHFKAKGTHRQTWYHESVATSIAIKWAI